MQLWEIVIMFMASASFAVAGMAIALIAALLFGLPVLKPILIGAVLANFVGWGFLIYRDPPWERKK